MEVNETKNITVQNLWDTAKEVLRGKYRATQDFLRKQEQSQISRLNSQSKNTRKRTNEAQS